jgi:hypothetical protein
MSYSELNQCTVVALKKICKDEKIKGVKNLKKADIILKIKNKRLNIVLEVGFKQLEKLIEN